MRFRRLADAVGHRPLWFQLALLAAIIAIPLILSSYVMYNRMVENGRIATKQSLLLTAKTMSALVEQEIQTHIAIASTLSHSPALKTNNLEEFWLEATAALEFVPGSSLDLSDGTGQILLSTLQPQGTPVQWKLPAEWVTTSLATRQSYVGNLTQHGVSKRQAIIVTTPFFLADNQNYILSISIPPERFQNLIKDKFTNGEVVAILDRDLKFVARIPDIEQRLGTLASEGWRAAIARSPEGWTENKTVEGNWSITGYAPTRHGWNVGVAQLESAFESPFQNIFWSTIAASLFLSAIGFMFAANSARHISKGMAAIADSARDLGDGKPVSELPAPFYEAQVISRNLAVASAELDRRSAALLAANALLETKVIERTQNLQDEMKRREESETALRQVQKIETIGQLTGGIAHDFNNMLTIIIGNLDTVQRRMAKSTDVSTLKQPIANALQGATSAANMTQRLLAFSRQQALQPKALSLNGLVSDISNMLTRMVGESVQIETVLAAGLWQAFADANQVENALVNLVVNARDAMPEGGKLSIETANAHLDDNYAMRFGDLKAGQYVLLSVTDEGSGIEPAKLEKVFEPFFTTKGPGKGTGLGLAMIHGFVKQSGGHVRIYSEVGHGTTVKIYLPRFIGELGVVASPDETVVNHTEMPRAKKNETILLVEDDEGVRNYATEVLTELGYKILVAEDGGKALNIFKGAKRVDILFTDVVLGGPLNGRELADKIRQTRPGLPVLFTTGYTRNAIIHHGRLDAGVNLLSKPYTHRDLALKIRNAIDHG